MKRFREDNPKNAVILAAGFGMRMVPINLETPKGLLEIDGEPLAERLIKQLQEVGIREIYVVTGFMQERYNYLSDKYGVILVENTEYAAKNNLHSLNLVVEHLSNSYIIPCDVWCAENPFRQQESDSWYMISDLVDDESTVRLNRRQELVSVSGKAGGNAMIGICYLQEKQAVIVREKIAQLCKNPHYDDAFWEEALYRKGRMIVRGRAVHSADVVEINTFEQLRELDSHSNQLKSDAMDVISSALCVKTDDIIDITVLKKGMTNRSFLFSCHNKKYIMRIPGEGSNHLIDRKKEALVYQAVEGRGICDDIVYINPENGYKITRFLENARVCNPFDRSDIKRCMKKLRDFHEEKLTVDYEFDIWGQIEFYEELRGEVSVYKNYQKIKEGVFSLRPYIDARADEKVLAHIDAVPDNFLFVQKNADENIRLIDWEYAGMCDPHIDIAMFCIYSLYDKRQIDRLINLYFTEGCPHETRIKIYCYIAAGGLLWSNWCEYKRNLGVEFGEYAVRQYKFAKDYFHIVRKELKELEQSKETKCIG